MEPGFLSIFEKPFLLDTGGSHGMVSGGVEQPQVGTLILSFLSISHHFLLFTSLESTSDSMIHYHQDPECLASDLPSHPPG